jgi:hypothetical protein
MNQTILDVIIYISHTRTQLQWSTFQCSPVKVLSVKEDRNIYVNGKCFLVRVLCISDIIFQFANTLSAPLELKGGTRGRDRRVVGFTCAISANNQVVRSNASMARCTRYSIMWFSLSVTCDRLDVFSPDNLRCNYLYIWYLTFMCTFFSREKHVRLS